MSQQLFTQQKVAQKQNTDTKPSARNAQFSSPKAINLSLFPYNPLFKKDNVAHSVPTHKVPSALNINGLAYCPQRQTYIKTTKPKSFSLSLLHRCLCIYLKRGRDKVRQKIQSGKQLNKISSLLSILSKHPKERHNHHHFEKKTIYQVTSRKEICYHS